MRLLKHNPDERITYEEFFSHEYLDLDHMPSKENYEKVRPTNIDTNIDRGISDIIVTYTGVCTGFLQ
jgi:hypothetical protein